MKLSLAASFILAVLCSTPALALDATSFDPLTVSVEALAISGVPVGTIIAWPVATNPEGWDEGNWLECNGQTISQAVYPELFAVVGSQVPDLRGLFLRGTGGNAAELGEVQGDGVKLPDAGGSFAGRANPSGSAVVYWNNPYTGAFTLTDEVVIKAMGRGWDYDEVWRRVSFNLANVSTAPETRPINQAVRYLIRAQS